MTDIASDLIALHDRMRMIEHGVHAKLDLALRAIHFILEKGSSAMDHDALLALAKSVKDDSIKAVSSFEAEVATKGTQAQALDDVGDVLVSVKADLAIINGAVVPSSPATPVTVTVSDPVESGSSTIPVDTASHVEVGSGVTGGALASGSTVTGATDTSITVSPPTVADHVGGETLTLTPSS